MNPSATAGQEFVRLARERGETPAELALRLGVKPSQITQYENGSDPSLPRLFAAALHDGLSTEEFGHLVELGNYRKRQALRFLRDYSQLMNAPPDSLGPQIRSGIELLQEGQPLAAEEIASAAITQLRRNEARDSKRMARSFTLLARALQLRIEAFVDSRSRPEIKRQSGEDLVELRQLGDSMVAQDHEDAGLVRSTFRLLNTEYQYILAEPWQAPKGEGHTRLKDTIESAKAFLYTPQERLKHESIVRSLRANRILVIATAQNRNLQDFSREADRLRQRTQADRVSRYAPSLAVQALEGIAKGFLIAGDYERSLGEIMGAIDVMDRLRQQPAFRRSAEVTVYGTYCLAVLSNIEVASRQIGRDEAYRAIRLALEACARNQHPRKFRDLTQTAARAYPEDHPVMRHLISQTRLLRKQYPFLPGPS